MELAEVFRRGEWAAAYQNTEEHPDGFWLDAEGEIPEALSGTYFRNGPGLFSIGTERFPHPFDGHGLVASIAFSSGKAFFRSRFVQTTEYKTEMAAGRILYKGTFGTRAPGGWLGNLFQIAPRNVSNTGILSTSKKCLTFFEAGQPYCLDPVTLETRGIDLLGGIIRDGAPFSTGSRLFDILAGCFLWLFSKAKNLAGGRRLGGDAVCAHPVTDPVSGNHVLFSFCLQLSLTAWSIVLFGWKLHLPGLITELTIRELNEDLEQVEAVHATLPGYCFLHDLGITPSHYVIFQNPVRLRMLPLLLGSLSPVHCIRWTGAAPKVHLFTRPGSTPRTPSLATSGAQEKGVSTPQQVQLVASSSTQPPASGPSTALESSASTSFFNSGLSEELHARTSQHASTASSPSCSGRSEGRGGESGSGFIFHQANAYEACGGELVVVDCIRYASMPDFHQASEGGQSFQEAVDPERQPISQLWRFEVSTTTGKLTCRRLSPRAMEFPAINPNFEGRQHRFVYAAAALHPTKNMPQQALSKLDTTTMNLKLWSPGVHFYVGEPVFVPSPKGLKEDEGWLISVCYDAKLHASECIVLDAESMARVACLPLRHVLPHGLHGSWNPACHMQL